MPDFSESMVFKVSPDTVEMNTVMEAWGRSADSLGKRISDAMIRGMSAAGGAGPGGMTQPRTGADPMAALTTIPEQERLLKQALEQAGPLLQRQNAWRAVQDRKRNQELAATAAAEHGEFMGGLGRAAAGGVIGEVGGLGGIGAMMAGGVSPAAAVTAGVETIRMPFNTMARMAENTSRSFAALNSNIGAAAQGFENAANRWRWVPLIGDQMARMKDAERTEMETKTGWMKLISPGGAQQLELANLRRQATEAYIEEQMHPVANRIAGADIASGARRALAPMEGRHWRWGMLAGVQEQKEYEFLNKVMEESQKPGGVSEARAAEIRKQYQEQFGKELPKPVQPALPAQIGGIEDFITNLQTQFATLAPQGMDQKDELTRGLTDEIRRLREVLEGQGKDDAGDGVDRAMDEAVDDLRRRNPGWLG